MKHFWLWLKWLGKGRQCYQGLNGRLQSIEDTSRNLKLACQKSFEATDRKFDAIDSERVDRLARDIRDLEKALADIQAAHAEEMHEIRERLDGRIKRQNPHRTFQQMRAIAELGERAAAAKREETHA